MPPAGFNQKDLDIYDTRARTASTHMAQCTNPHTNVDNYTKQNLEINQNILKFTIKTQYEKY